MRPLVPADSNGQKTDGEHRLNALYVSYDRVSKSEIRKAFATAGSFFAPTFAALQAAMDRDPAQRGYALLGTGRAAPKGKAREVVCVELEKERGWVMKGVREPFPS